MPSPFPGMDPYLEAPDIWPDFHHALGYEIGTALNHTILKPCYARLGMWPGLGLVEIPDQWRLRIPDRSLSPSIEVQTRDEPIRHHYVEIRDPTRGHKLVTLIEILSPSNKRPGPDRDAYLAKQREVLDSDASLVEINLLRSGGHPHVELDLTALLDGLDPPTDYLVLVSRAWTRGVGSSRHQIFPGFLRAWQPCVPVPLKPDEPGVPLDLQYVVNRAYDTGPYRRGAVDYAVPPDPPLPPDDVAWAAEQLRAAGTLPALELPESAIPRGPSGE